MARPSINPTLVYASDPGTETEGVGFEAVGAAEICYNDNSFDPLMDPPSQSIHCPAGGESYQPELWSDENLTYTPARKLKMIHNTYPQAAASGFSVFCYVDDWAQYDNRYDPYCTVVGGRGADFMWLKDSAYDKFVLGFASLIGYEDTVGILDDKTTLTAYHVRIIPVNSAAEAEKPENKGKLSFADTEGDFVNYRNCGFTGWLGPDADNNYSKFYSEATARGAIGALNLVKNDNPSKTVSVSLGGWSMSYGFSELCADTAQQDVLVASIKDFITEFTMFSHIDLDWEYPGSQGVGNAFSAQDGNNFATLIEKVKSECDIGVSIAISANLDTLQTSDILATANRLNACEVHYNLMSYDMFTLEANGVSPLAHHTNLLKTGDGTSEHSTEAAIEYLLNGGSGVTAANLFIGYAGYSRNARNATLEEISPLKGTYDAENANVVGSFEYGVTELPDLLSNYLNLEGMVLSMSGASDDAAVIAANVVQMETTGFMLCTDTVANADFLYNPTSKIFMSIETPRSVNEKAKFVKSNNLGGLFIWTGDQDNGLLANAAWEGLEQVADPGGFDMAPYYQVRGVSTMAEYQEVLDTLSPPPPPSPGLAVPREPAYSAGA